MSNICYLKPQILNNNLTCKNCKEYIQTNANVCYDCGLETGNVEYSNYSFEEEQISKKPIYNSRLSKMQEWFTWTGEEKSEYKLDKYTRDFCDNLNILFKGTPKIKLVLTESIIIQIVYFVSEVMKSIKNNFSGPKRSKVKNGIIIMCIYYVLKSNNIHASYIDISKMLNIEIKHISNANKTITSLINNGKLILNDDFKKTIFNTEKPIDYINKIIKEHHIKINSNILNQTSELINICEDNDILLDHTPLSVGVCCFYYVLILNSKQIDTKKFSEIYDISIVTIDKTYKKLLKYKQQISDLGINILL